MGTHRACARLRRLITIAGTVSPSSADTEHSLSTLKTISAAAGTEHLQREVTRDVKAIVAAPSLESIPPKQWDEERVRSWLAEAVTSRGEVLAPLLPRVPAGTTGALLMKRTAVQMRQLWGAPGDLAEALFHELRVVTKRADAAKDKGRRGEANRRANM